MSERRPRTQARMRVIPRFVHNPEKADRGLKAMADILAGALRQAELKGSDHDGSEER